MTSYSTKEIAEKLGISMHAVQQIEKSAMKKLRSPSVGRKLRDRL